VLRVAARMRAPSLGFRNDDTRRRIHLGANRPLVDENNNNGTKKIMSLPHGLAPDGRLNTIAHYFG